MSLSRLSWQDLYYDGLIDEENEVFDEDCQEIVHTKGIGHHSEVVCCERYECMMY